MAVKIKQMPPQARPRERLYRLGPGALSDAELLALVIQNGRKGASAVEVGTEILAEHGSLSRLNELKPEELERLTSIGSAKAAALVAALEIGRRASVQSHGPTITCPADLAALVRPYMSNSGREEAFLVALSNNNKIRKVERLGNGGQVSCGLEVREVLTSALRLDSVALAIVHSHPSGDPTPSAEDKVFTGLLSEAAERIGLRFVDHVIVAGRRWLSMSHPNSLTQASV